MSNTTYFDIAAADITDEILPDTDCADTDIESLAQRIEYSIMAQLGISTAPTDTIQLEDLKRAIILLVASALEGREPHSQAEGNVRVDKYSRILWAKEAKEILRRYQTNVPIAVTRYGD
jgi:hypothetical protein